MSKQKTNQLLYTELTITQQGNSQSRPTPSTGIQVSAQNEVLMLIQK